jgi:hypothetical protein
MSKIIMVYATDYVTGKQVIVQLRLSFQDALEAAERR